MRIQQKIKGILRNYLLHRYYVGNRKMFAGYFSKIKQLNPDIKMPPDTARQKEWLKKWGVFGERPNLLGYQVFSHFMGENANFVPNEIARTFMESVLTPNEFQPFYNDKNSFNLFLDEQDLPKTYCRSMNGRLYDGKYNSVSREDFLKFPGIDKIVVKPSRDMGGKGVALFHRDKEHFVDEEGHVLSLEYLENAYRANYLIQECLKQSPFMAQFNPTSINTLRIATYRDVESGNIVVLGAVLRMGGKGAFVDNACSGGSFVFVDEHGKLGKKVCDEYGRMSSIHNDINFSDNDFIVPNYDKVKSFVIHVAQRMPHMSLFANDVILDEENNPKLIEVNTTQFSYWFYQFNAKPVFGEYTDDLIAYCKKEKGKVRLGMMLKYN